jgi:hypothetical protein
LSYITEDLNRQKILGNVFLLKIFSFFKFLLLLMYLKDENIKKESKKKKFYLWPNFLEIQNHQK